MRIKSMFRVFTFFAAILIFSAPLMAVAHRHEPTLEELRRRRTPLQKEEVPAQPENTAKALERSVRDQATRDANRDVDRDVNTTMWFIFGCVFPAVGMLAPYFYKPPIPASTLLGKSPEYVAYYTDAYNRKRQNKQFTAALMGQASGCCLFGMAVVLQASQ